MYPHRELSGLASHKSALRRRITSRRTECNALATHALRPLAWADTLLSFWRSVSPVARLAVIPLGFLLKRSPARRPRLLGTLLRWAPLVLGALRGLKTGHRE